MKTFGRIFSFVIIGAFLLLAYACKKDKQVQGGAALVNIKSVEVSYTEASSNNNSANAKSVLPGLSEQVKEVTFNQDYNLIVSLKPKTQELKAQGSTRGSSVINPMEQGVRYRVLVFNTDNSYVDQKEFIVGQEASTTGFELEPGTYRFVAYSFNNSTAIPEVAQSPLDGLSLSNIPTSSALLYMNREVTVQGGENLLGLVLKHRFSKITLTMEAASELGTISALKASITAEPTVNMALKDGALTHPNTPSPLMFNFPTLNLATVTSTSTLISNAETAQLELKILEIGLNGGPIRTDLANITDLVIRPGVQYQLRLSLQSTGISVGGKIWAKGNLAYVNGIYFNRSSPEETGFDYHATDYWNYASAENPVVPAMNVPWEYFEDLESHFPKIPATFQDPCQLVAGGQWHMPKLADFAALGYFKVINSAGVEGAFDGVQPNGEKTGHAYIYFDGTDESTGAAGQLRFYKTGRMKYYVVNNISVLDHDHIFNEHDAFYMAIDGTQGVKPVNATWQVHMPMIVEEHTGGDKDMLYYRLNDPYFSRDDRVPIRCVRDLPTTR